MMMPVRILLCLTLPLAVALGSDHLFRLLGEWLYSRRVRKAGSAPASHDASQPRSGDREEQD